MSTTPPEQPSEVSKTPRTDEVEFGFTGDAMQVDASFARTLELELNEAKELIRSTANSIIKERENCLAAILKAQQELSALKKCAELLYNQLNFYQTRSFTLSKDKGVEEALTTYQNLQAKGGE